MAGKSVIRIHFMDSRVKAFAIDSGATADQLLKEVKERIELKEGPNFAIFEKKDEWERCLDPDEKPADLVKSWPAAKPDVSAEGEKSDAPRFIFKKKTFIRDDDKEMADPIARNLLYIQAVANVIQSDYPCTPETAIKLAGIQLHIVYGDHNPSTQTVGFLKNNLKDYIPVALFASKRPGEWEAAILAEHAKHVGANTEDAKAAYLAMVKKLPYYGTTFYPPCKSVSNGRKIPNKVIIGVNAEGILLLKPKDKELIATFPYTEICSWASSSSTFAFEFGVQSEALKYTFETKYGAIIASAIQTYIDILVDMLTNGNDEETSSTCDGSDGED